MCKEAKSTYAFLYDFGWKGNDEDAKFTHPDFPGHVIKTLQGGRWNSGARWRHEVNGKVVEKADEAHSLYLRLKKMQKVNSQTIRVRLELKTGQKPYEVKERSGSGREYEALRHFFEDIGYKVKDIKVFIGSRA